MEFYFVTPLKVVHHSSGELTYQSETVLELGQLVVVEVGKKEVPAVITGKTSKPAFATKPIVRTIEERALPRPLVELAQWMSVYYSSHPVAVWQTILPRGLDKKRRNRVISFPSPERDRTTIVLNSEQTRAVSTIMERESGTTLLHGVTGSGKTEVYIELMRRTLAAGKSAILLVPEIALTSQIIADLLPHFPDLIVTHSTMTEAERHTVWKNALSSDKPVIVLGPRSALFTPVPNLGLIVIDECHEPSFKQEQTPRYSALRAGAILADRAGARLVLGSATPSVSDYYLAQRTGTPVVAMHKRARTNTIAPSVELIDMTKKLHFTKHRFLSNDLLARITETLEAGHQVLIFHNRRGSAPMTLCEQCGWSAACPRCFVPLTLHADSFELRCHICNHLERVPTSCPTCHNASIIHKGIGTKLVAEELRRLFPKATIMRFDGDSIEGETLEKHYQSLYDGQVNIIIGTQVVAKGLDLPHLRMVGVIQADSGLALPDFSSTERVFQLLAQVSGRVGRNEHSSRVIVQSYQPEHPSVALGIQQDFEHFYEYCLSERQHGRFPPFTHLLKLTCVYKTEAAAIRASRELARTLRSKADPSVTILGPAPAFYERVRDTYRWQLILKSPTRGELINCLAHLPRDRWQYELDPSSLL
jgi:primosomal protein N' (replication factor Y)